MLDTWPLFLLMLSWLSSYCTIKKIIEFKKRNVFDFESLSKNNVKWVLILISVMVLWLVIIACYFLLLGFNKYEFSFHSLILLKLLGVVMLVFSATSLIYHCSKDKHSHC